MAFPAAILGMLSHPVTTTVAALKAAGAAWSRRRVLGQLGQLDDRMLRDIGITRHDVISAMSEPMFRDPTIGLVDRAREGRQAARAAARDRLTMAHLLRTWHEENRAA